MTDSSPLLIDSPLPYGFPQFDKIRDEHFAPAIEQGMQQLADVEAIANSVVPWLASRGCSSAGEARSASPSADGKQTSALVDLEAQDDLAFELRFPRLARIARLIKYEHARRREFRPYGCCEKSISKISRLT